MEAMDKLASWESAGARACLYRRVRCGSCGAACSVRATGSLDGIACVACVRPLSPAGVARTGPGRALRELADWWDKGYARGLAYVVVSCPHCSTRCIVGVGRCARTGCPGCLRPLGSGPLIREDVPRGSTIEARAGNEEGLGA
jgi:hypothetical protein